MLKPWKLLSSKTLIKNKCLNLIEEKLETESGGNISPFYKFETGSWGMVIAKTNENQFVLVKQYRRGIDEICLEFPAGAIETNEDFADGLKRELLEETGYSSEEPIILLGQFPVNPANQTGEVVIFFWDKVILTHGPNLDPTEEIEVVLMSEADVQESFKSLVIKHPIHHLAWYRYLEMRNKS